MAHALSVLPLQNALFAGWPLEQLVGGGLLEKLMTPQADAVKAITSKTVRCVEPGSWGAGIAHRNAHSPVPVNLLTSAQRGRHLGCRSSGV